MKAEYARVLSQVQSKFASPVPGAVEVRDRVSPTDLRVFGDWSLLFMCIFQLITAAIYRPANQYY